MRILFLIIGLIHAGCAQRGQMASDSMASGHITASAFRRIENGEACFDIILNMRGVGQKDISLTNWTLAWIDRETRYYFLTLNQRNPASAPKGVNKGWVNEFKTCAPKAKPEDVKILIFNPKTLPFKETEGMRFEWP